MSWASYRIDVRTEFRGWFCLVLLGEYESYDHARESARRKLAKFPAVHQPKEIIVTEIYDESFWDYLADRDFQLPGVGGLQR